MASSEYIEGMIGGGGDRAAAKRSSYVLADNKESVLARRF